MERKADQHERASCQSRNRVRKRDESGHGEEEHEGRDCRVTVAG